MNTIVIMKGRTDELGFHFGDPGSTYLRIELPAFR